MADSEKYEKGYERMLKKATGRSVGSYRADAADEYREDGYVNMLNKYGTAQDVSEHYRFVSELPVPDTILAVNYESNGLFAKIIDAPAEEAVKHGFELDGMADKKIEDYITTSLDSLDWDETAITSLKWDRLFSGSIAVMLIDDGRGLEEPLDWRHIKSIDDIRVFDRSRIQPDYESMYRYDPKDPFGVRSSRWGMPERYYVFSRSGDFVVHDSRCLVFQNGVLPEITTNSLYRIWGVPEYVRINKAVRDAEVAHGSAPKLLDRSVQPIYKMRDLAAELATEEGEDRVIRRLQAIDLAKGLMNTIAIDGEGEEYDFRTFQFSGVSSVIESSCNFLSAVTSIPQTILFGRSPAGMNATGHADFENYYNYVERIQKRMLRKNLRYLIYLILVAGKAQKKVDEIPDVNIKFKPLWSMSEEEETALEQQKAQAALARAQVAQAYVQMQVISPEEVRKSLAESDEFDVETMLDGYTPEELEENAPQPQEQDPMAAMLGGGAAPGAIPGGVPTLPKRPEAQGGATQRTGEGGIKVDPQELKLAHQIDKESEELRIAHEIDKKSEELAEAHKVDAEMQDSEMNEDDVGEDENPYETTEWKNRVMDVSNRTGMEFEQSEAMLVAIEDFAADPGPIQAVQSGMSEEEFSEQYEGDYDVADTEGDLLERFVAMSAKFSGGNLMYAYPSDEEEAANTLEYMKEGKRFSFDVTTLWKTRSSTLRREVEGLLQVGIKPVVFVWKNAKTAASITFAVGGSADVLLASKRTTFVAERAYELDGVVFVECVEVKQNT